MLLGSYVLPSPAQPRKRSPCRHSRFGVSLASRHHPLLEGSPALRRSALHQATRRGPITLRRRFYCLTDRLRWLSRRSATKDLRIRRSSTSSRLRMTVIAPRAELPWRKAVAESADGVVCETTRRRFEA